MKTISLEEAKKLAAPGKLTADCMRIYSNDGEFWIASTDAPGPATDEEAIANAALLAHRWNHFDELVESVDDLLAYIGEQGDCPPKCMCTLCSVKAVLAKARAVEMP